jgi:hypothetical protein
MAERIKLEAMDKRNIKKLFRRRLTKMNLVHGIN